MAGTLETREPRPEDVSLAFWLEQIGYGCPALKTAMREWEATFTCSPRSVESDDPHMIQPEEPWPRE